MMFSYAWSWLNANSAAIQALATVVLVLITAAYVYMTSGLARAAADQLSARAEDRQTRRVQLDGDVSYLKSWLFSLPECKTSPDAQRKISDASRLDDFEFGEFCGVASELGYIAGKAAATARSKVRFLLHVIGKIQETPSGIGYQWNDFPEVKWVEARRKAIESLMSIKDKLGINESDRFGGSDD